MDFELSPRSLELQRKAHAFADAVMRPQAARYDQSGEFPVEIFRRAFAEGLMNGDIPPEYGGAGWGVLDACVAVEELAWACAGMTTSMEVSSLAQAPIIQYGTPEQKEKWLRPFTQEFRLASFCASETGMGSDVANIQAEAVRDGDDYILNGTKFWITNGNYADVYSIITRTDKEGGHKGLSAFIVPADTPGISTGRPIDKMGHRASDTCAVFLKDVRVPSANRLGSEGDGFMIAMNSFNHTRPAVACLAIGIARRAMELCLQYSVKREAFGAPIAMYEGIQFMVADMAMDIEAARLLAHKAAWMMDEGKLDPKLASYAKAFAADTAMRITTDAVQIHGGFGYTKLYPVEKLMRDAKLIQIYEGTSQIQRLLIVRRLYKESMAGKG